MQSGELKLRGKGTEPRSQRQCVENPEVYLDLFSLQFHSLAVTGSSRQWSKDMGR